MSELLPLAVALARRAGAELRQRFAGARTIDFKGGQGTDLVTDADRASEALLLEGLRREVPEHAVLAEESGAHPGHAFTWFVDPLDGTTNYAHGVPHFAVTLAVADAAGVLAGVVYEPLRDECFAAARGQGATLNGAPLRASAAPSLARALLATGFPYDVQARPERPLGLLSRLVVRAQGLRRMGSAALDLAWVAAGRCDGFFELGLKPWDTAAGALLVAEAGGVVRRLDGAPYEPWVGDVVAAAPGVAPELVAECEAFARQHGWTPRRFGRP